MYSLTDEQIDLILRMKQVIDKGHSFNSKQVTDLYNQVFNKRLSNTSCSTCIRRRISELYNYYDKGRNK